MNKTTHVFGTVALAACAMASMLSLGACQIEPPGSPVVGLRKPIDPPRSPDLGRGAQRISTETRYHLWLGDSVREVCKGPSPFFEFDSDHADAEQPTMSNLATCMNHGPLVGKKIVLIGHTDPRGSSAYNDELGLDRAEKVKRYLVGRGVSGERIATATAGEDEASHAPADWPTDRRVQIQLAKN